MLNQGFYPPSSPGLSEGPTGLRVAEDAQLCRQPGPDAPSPMDPPHGGKAASEGRADLSYSPFAISPASSLSGVMG
jgi:hypothetical protein